MRAALTVGVAIGATAARGATSGRDLSEFVLPDVSIMAFTIHDRF